MSEFSIKQYQNEVEKIIHFGGTKKETAIRNAFYNLLNDYAKQKGLMIVPEVTIKAANGKNVTPDGTLKDMLRQDWGYWESKDESDDLDEEIKKKFGRGYPKDNIIFEDSQTAVLFQNGGEVMRVPTKDAEALHNIITRFISFERPEVQHFRKAIELFKQDIPKVTETLRGIIIAAEKTNPQFIKASETFLKLCHDSINPNITKDDVREMIIQHILTEDVFNTIFDETQFHRENNIARELEKVIHTFFTGSTRKVALGSVQHYYQAINAAAAGIADHHEKQKFLKVIYETFYKSYNPKAADRLGVVYTPNEIVQFMIQSTDFLLNKHFNKFLEDKGVDILDPATGTGTFICDMIDYMGKDKLEYKYQYELHANELSILPYYISNLNIEYTYTQKMGKYSEFKNLCFVDTLDNIAGLSETVTGIHSKYKVMGDLFSITTENSQRIIDQNRKKISVIIGNPPYNANQANESDNNKNREYLTIDKRIKDTFIKNSTAQKTKVYDMYSRFYRWAIDRLDNKGIIAFITNNSFVNSRTFDGFRKSIQDEFQAAYIIDLGGNIRELSGRDGIFLNENHTIFGQAAAVGIAMMFLIRDSSSKSKKCNIQYIHPTDIRATREQKLAYLADHKFADISFEHIQPDKNNNWIHLAENDFDELLPLKNKENSKFQLFESSFLGVSTNRDEWVYDLDKKSLEKKILFFEKMYNRTIENNLEQTNEIKWTNSLQSNKKAKRKLVYNKANVTLCTYRPFVQVFYYNEKITSDRLTKNHFEAFGNKLNNQNVVICMASYERKPFAVLAIKNLPNLNYFGDPANCLPLFRYDENGNRIENITNWGLNQFAKNYKTKKITKENILHYIYAILHNPAYRTKYELNLKREFPRIPFYEDFNKWAAWGKALMDLHINYETVKPYPLERIDVSIDLKAGYTIEDLQKSRLKALKADGIIEIDSYTDLKGIPPEAWDYKLGNRSALEWVLDQYKESKPKDPTIAEKFNTYKFSDYKEQVIDLLKKVCTVSVETMKIINEMQ